jgi:hypothetical protein
MYPKSKYFEKSKIIFLPIPFFLMMKLESGNTTIFLLGLTYVSLCLRTDPAAVCGRGRELHEFVVSQTTRARGEVSGYHDNVGVGEHEGR